MTTTTIEQLEQPVTPRRRRRRLRTLVRRCAIIVCLLATLAAAAVYHFTRPERLAALGSSILADVTGGDVRIGAVRLSLDGTVIAHDVELAVPGLEGEGARLFEAESAIIKLDLWQALRGDFVASEALVMRPTLWLTEIEEQRFNYERLQRERDPDAELHLPDLPHIHVREGRVRYGEMHDGAYHSVGNLHVNGRLDPDAQQAGLYHFQLAPEPEDYAASVAQPTLRGQFDLNELTVRAELNDFTFVDPHRNMLPRQIRRWWDLFEPSGSLPNIRFDYDAVTGPEASVAVEGVSLSLPQLSEDVDFETRMTDVTGTFHFNAQRIRVENLVGEIEGLQYRINGVMEGYRPDAAFELSVETLPFRIPEEPRFMPAMPLDVQEIFSQINPALWVRVSLALSRAEAAGEIAYDGTATILSGTELVAELMRDPRWRRSQEPLNPNDPRFSSRGEYTLFPYPVHDIRGVVMFNPERVELRDITGRLPGGGRLEVQGRIGPPSPEAHVDLRVKATNVRFDDMLYDALHEKQQRIADMFMDEAGYARLREGGHLISSADKAAAEERRGHLQEAIDAAEADSAEHAALSQQLATVEAVLQRPVFDFGGRLDVEVRLDRQLSQRGADGLEVLVDLAGVNVMYEHFSYPGTVRDGQVIVRDNRVTLANIRAEGLHGGEAVVGGYVDLVAVGEQRRVAPEVELTVEAMPLDALLVEAVPAPHNQWLADLDATGAVDVNGRIFREGDVHADRDVNEQRPPINIDMAISVADASMAPGRGRYPLSGVTGQLRLTLDDLEIESLRARHGEGRLSLSGDVAFRGEDGPSFAFTGEGAQLRLEEPVLDLVAPAVGDSDVLESFWERYDPAGRFDAAFTYQSQGARTPPHYELRIEPADLAFDFRDQRIALTEVEGAIGMTPAAVTLEQLAGRFDEAERFRVDGELTLGEQGHARVGLDLRGEGLSPTLQHLAPDTVGDLLRDAAFTGAYHLDAPLVEIAFGEEREHEARVQATLHLEGAAIDLGIPLRDFDGSIAMDLQHDHQRKWPRFDVGVHAPRLTAAGRAVEDLSLAMRNSASGEGIEIRDIRGRMAGGNLTGRGGVDPDAGRFQLELMIGEAALGSLMNGAGRPRQTHVDAEAGTVTVSTTPPAPEAGADAEAAEADDENGVDGRLSLSLAVEGGWKDDTAVRGRGDLHVRDANLRGVPLAMGLLQITHLTLPADQTFERASSTYYVHGDQIVFEAIQLDAPGLRIGGSGTVNYRSRELDLTLTTSNPAGLKLGPVTTVIDGFRNQLITLRVIGTTDEPRLQVRQLDGVSEAWRDVFGEE